MCRIFLCQEQEGKHQFKIWMLKKKRKMNLSQEQEVNKISKVKLLLLKITNRQNLSKINNKKITNSHQQMQVMNQWNECNS